MFSAHDWFYQNVDLLRRIFGDVIYDDLRQEWVRVDRLPLPRIFYQSTTRLLITAPFPHLDLANGYKFYVNRGLRR